MMLTRTFSVVFASLFAFSSLAKADEIDFEQFNLGDGLTEINAFYNPLGIQFLTDGGVGEIQLVGGSKVFAAFTPNANAFDILINFDFRIDNISARFLNNGGTGTLFSVLEGYDRHKIPGPPIVADGFLFSVFGDDPITLSYTWPGPGISDVRTLHLSQDLAHNDFVTVDNIQFTSVPEPSMIHLLVGCSVILWLRRRQST